MKHVLMVEDKEANLYYLEALFRGHGFSVDSARHGAEALVLARRKRPDVVVSDLLMPVMDGYTLLRQWKADPALREIPFIVYTATYTEPADERLALDLGADAFMVKPMEPEDLIAKVRAVIADPPRRRPAAPSGDDDALMETYSHALIRKLEEKTVQLEATNAALARDISERERSERERRALVHQLGERVKELRAMHRVSDLLGRDGLDGERLLTAIVAELPRAFQHVDLASARLTLGTLVAATEGYADSPHELRREFQLADGRAGCLSVCYAASSRLTAADVFLDEERAMLDSIAAMLVTHLDRRAATERLQANEARLREQAALLDAAQDAIVVRDLNGVVSFWNKGAERLYGWAADEARGRAMDELLATDHSEYALASRAVLDGGEWIGELHQRTRDGRAVVVEARWTLLRDEAGQPRAVLGINTDITARKAMEQQFLRAQRMESIGTLAGGIAHDLNNVLAPIVMGIDLLRETASDPETRETVELIAESAHRGSEMVKQVLSFARGVEGRRRRLDPAASLRDVARIVRETFPRNIELREEVEDGLWAVQADATQIHQVLLNLCVNARDAMPRGGTLSLRAANVQLDRQYAAMNIDAQEGPHVRLEVEDTGDGIPPEVLDRIFDPFFTTKEVGKGTGLGLSTTLAITKAHGGFVRAYSETGRGARFRVYLPAHTGDDEPLTGGPDTELPRGAGQTILLVDDEEAIRHVTEATLTQHGYRVLTAADGAEAVKLYSAQRDTIALVVTDMMMPVMDGRATIDVLRRMNPTLPIIAASGLATGVGSGGEMGDIAFLPKPFTAATLLRAVGGMLRG